jgi:hypothetical protein
MNMIVRPISSDGNVGFDKFEQLVIQKQEGKYTTTRIVHNSLDETCPICGKGWEPTVESLENQWGISCMGKYTRTKSGELGHSDRPCHYSCYKGMLYVKEAQMWYDIFCDREINKGPGYEIDEVPNEYNGGWNNPWYRYRPKHLPGVDIVVGSRKRVYQIKFLNLGKDDIKSVELALEKFDGTKGETSWYSAKPIPGYFLHVDNEEEAKEAIRLASNALLESVTVKC